MKILLAIDGSPSSEAAVNEVAVRDWPEGTEVKILSAVKVAIPYIPDPLLLLETANLKLREIELNRLTIAVEQAADQLRESKSGNRLKIATEILDGSPKEVIVDEAERWGADLVVVGSHGYGNVKRFLLGSVSQAVANHAPCSVQIIRSRQKE
jgi:nucleotide-binding universal stress UspA family protein